MIRCKKLVAEADTLTSRGRFAEALPLLREAVGLDPEYIVSRINLANVLADLGERTEAMAAYEGAIAIDPKSFEATANAAILALELEEEEENLSDEQQRRSLEGTSTRSSCSDRADEYFEADSVSNNLGVEVPKRTSSVALFRRALELNPAWFEGSYNLANLLSASGSGYEAEAINLYLRAAKLNPTSSSTYNNLGLCLLTSGNLPAACIACRRACHLSEERDAGSLNNLATCLRQMGQMQEALIACLKALKVDSSFAAAHFQAGQIYRLSDKPHLAPEHMARALACLNESSPESSGGSLISGTCGSRTRHSKQYRDYGMVYFFLLRNLIAGSAPSSGYPEGAEFSTGNLAATWQARSRIWVDDAVRDACERLEELVASRTAIEAVQAAHLDLVLLLFLAGKVTEAQEMMKKREIEGIGQENTRRLITSACISEESLRAVACASVLGSSEITHKGRLYRNLVAAGLEGLAPKTFLISSLVECEEAMGLSAGDPDARCHLVWFLKDPHMQRAQGVHIIRTRSQMESVFRKIRETSAGDDEDEVRARIPKEFCLQPHVRNPALINGRKFGLRVHALVVYNGPCEKERGSGSLFVFNEAILTICGAEYDPEDVRPLVQITCTSVQRGLSGFNRNEVKGSARQMWGEENWLRCYPSIRRSIALSVQCVRHRLKSRETNHSWRGPDAPHFQIFGYDFLIDQSFRPWLLEVNAAPQFGDPQRMPELRESVALPMINGIGAVLACGNEGKTSSNTFWEEANLDIPFGDDPIDVTFA